MCEEHLSPCRIRWLRQVPRSQHTDRRHNRRGRGRLVVSVGSEKRWIGWAAVAVGVCAVVAAFAASSTRVGEGFAFGFGAFIAFFGLLAVLARNRTPDHWGLVVVGLAIVHGPVSRQRLQRRPRGVLDVLGGG